MSKTMSRLLAKSEDEVTKAVSKLEASCGYPSEDVRLLAENKGRLRHKIGQLGLDPDDTTDEELYHALRTRFERDSQMLDKALGVDEGTKLDTRIDKAIQLAGHCASTDEMWVVKSSIARSLLVKNPPKHIAKNLHYRSIASMIKREDVAGIFLAASVAESTSWCKSIAGQLAKLSAASFELRPLRIINLRPERWGDAQSLTPHVVYDEKMGAVAIWPSEDLRNTSVLSLTLLLLEGLHNLNPSGYREALHELSPALRWWADAEQLISDGEQPVSLNLKDVSLNHLKKHDLAESARHHGARSLWEELTVRYQKISESLTDRLPDVEYNFEQVKLPTSAELYEEYVQAE
ncbi:hypothetical protein HY379_01155 [Candidatus Saccharibacteria bacterium]|nr:hypothetical protein [Candidatus Saccharibacteria bacterium]